MSITPPNPAGAPVPTPVAPAGPKRFVFKTPPPFDLRPDPWVLAIGDYDYTWYETWADAMAVALTPEPTA